MIKRRPLVSIHGLMKTLIEWQRRAYFEEGVRGGCTGQYRQWYEIADSAFERLRGAALQGKLRGWHNGMPLDYDFWQAAWIDLTRYDIAHINGFDMSGIMFDAEDVKAAFFPAPKMPKVWYPSWWQRLLQPI